MELIPKAKYRRASWKNGLGFTDEIAIHPAGTDLRQGNFLWRLSSAQIEQASAFSSFPNHDRTLVILRGGGVRLTHTFAPGEEESIEVTPLEPYEFPGDVPSRCELLGGPVTDLSVFTRKAEVEALTQVIEIAAGEGHSWVPAGRWNFVYALRGSLSVSGPTRAQLEEGDTASLELRGQVDEGAAYVIRSTSGTGQCVIVELQG